MCSSDLIVLRVIGHVGALRQFIGDGEAAGGVVHQGFQQKPLVTGHGGGGPLLGPGLRNVKDLFHIVGLSAPVIKCKKTPRKKCSFVAKEVKKR